MKIKIISDGSSRGTKVVDVETGETLNNVRMVRFEITAKEQAKVTLEFDDVELEAVGELEDEL